LTIIFKPKTVNELKQFANKFKALSRVIPKLQTFALERAGDEVLIDIHNEMKSKEFSEKIIETTYVGPIDITQGKEASIHFISDYVADNGFDVGEAREEGTFDHPIIPKPGNKTGKLWWVDPKTGRLLSSKGHWVSGLERFLIVETTIAKDKNKAKNSYENNIVNSYRSVLGV